MPRKAIDTHKRPEVPEPTRVERRLSDRETSVVRLVVEGRPNKEIGRILNISLKTVETHRATAMRKLRLSSLAGLVRYAVRNGLIKP
ncbi:MAG TPA: LuxR C-terminal-related transcriptional regulator [Hyphomicrobiaceae bacterium]|nr:LuxR C-terminal-related transcriptional regulator [Hyphomicrobiaceae bacterium]